MVIKYTVRMNGDVSVYIDNEFFLKDLYKYVHNEYNFSPINRALGDGVKIEIEFLDVEEHYGSPFIKEESTIDIFGQCFASYHKRMEEDARLSEYYSK